MNIVTPGVSRNIFKKKKVVKIIAICLVAALLTGGAYVFVQRRNNRSNGTVAQRTTKVVKGTLIDSITGSAPIQSSNRSELSPKVTATLEQINCREGDQVKAGDVLFVLDNTDALLNIENAKNNIDQMQLTLDSTAGNVSGLVVKAPYSGQITNISVKLGDTVNKGGSLLTITDVSKLNVTLAFSGAAVKNVTIGQKATVYLQDLMLSVEGSVTYKSSRPFTTASGGELYNIEIAIDNPGSLSEGMTATAEIAAGGAVINSVDSGTLSYVNSKFLKSDAGGTITSLKVRENEFVNAGEVLMQLENDDLLLSASSNGKKMESLLAQLEIQQKQLTYYSIVAPFDGTITKLGNANEGDTVKQGEVLAVLSDMGHLQFSVSIDELDISQLAIDQEVNITAEAIEETAANPLKGKVSKIAMEGSSSNGVTTYPVTVEVVDASASKLKTGMNIDAEIFISNKADVLMVPLEAVTKMGNRSFVYVKNTGGLTGQTGSVSQENPDRMIRRNANGAQAGTNPDGASGSGATGSWPQRNRTQGNSSQGTAPTQGNSSQGTTTAESNSSQGTRRTQDTDTQVQQPNAQQDQQTNNFSTGAVQGNFARMAQRANTDTYYADAVLIPVETGISNDSFIEILSGLTEGQEIVLPKLSTNTSTGSGTNNQRGQNFRIGGEVMGAMPAGGLGRN